MGKHKCSNCGEIHYINLAIDEEISCPECGFVDQESLIGQKSGRSTNLADD